MDNFKTTEQLFSRILEDFGSFTQAQLIDEGMFYKDVKYILTLLGIMWFREAETVLEVKNYRACLPADFKLLDAAYSCQGNIVDTPQPDGLVLQQLSFDHYPSSNPDFHGPVVCGAPSMTCCPTGYNYYDPVQKKCYCQGANCLSAQPVDPIACPPATTDDAIFNRHVLTLVKRGDCMWQYHTPKLLRIGNVNTKKSCTTNCANVFSTEADTITIQGGSLFTNFREGSVFMRYHAFPIDEETGLPLIPDDPIIEKCLEMYIKANIIRNLWTNSEADVAQQVNYYDNLSREALLEAKHYTKLPTFQTTVNAIRLTRKRLNVYQLYPASPSWPQSKRI